jgi:hypothetical protein
MKAIFVLLLFNMTFFTKAQVFFRLGERVDPLDYQKAKIAVLPIHKYVLASSFSLKPYAPTPLSQETYGNCTAWAVAYAARTILESVVLNRKDTALSRRNAFSPHFLYEQIKSFNDKTCDSGGNLYYGLNALLTKGVPKMSEFPMTCNMIYNDMDLVTAASNRIADFLRLDDAEIILNIKTALTNKKPVVCALTVTPMFQKLRGKELWSVTDKEIELKRLLDNHMLVSPGAGYHSVCIVGYDDAKEGGVLEIQNSWGSEWGASGYFIIRYSDFLKMYFKYSCFVMSVDPETKTAKPDETIFEGRLIFIRQGTKSPLPLQPKEVILQGQKISNFFSYRAFYRSSDEFSFLLSLNYPLYVYLIFFNTSKISADQLYPEVGKEEIYSNEHHIPQGTISFDPETPTDYLTFIFSKDKLDVEQIVRKIKNEKGGYEERLIHVLKGRQTIIDMRNLDNFQFALGENGRVLPITIEVIPSIK